MRHASRLLPVALFAFLSPVPPSLLAASFEGLVFEVRDGRRAGIAGARIEVRRAADRLATAFSDEQGRYRVDDLADSRLTIAASKPGWQMVRAGPRARSDLLFDCSGGGVCAAVDFELSRGGVVTGQLFDEFGEPVAGALIRLTPVDASRGTVRWGGGGQSDDRGIYRIGSLAAGRYTLAAELGPQDTDGHKYQYETATATVSVEGEGETQAPALVLRLVRKYRVSGRVEGIRSGDGDWLYGRSLFDGLITKARDLPAVQLDREGRFTIESAPEGKLDFRLPTAGGNPEVFLGQVDVAGDVEGIVLRPEPAGKIAGRVVREGAPLDRPIEISLSETTRGGRARILAAPPDFSFNLELQGGDYVVAYAEPRGYVKSMREGDTPLRGRRITLRPLESRELIFVVTEHYTNVSGRVRLSEPAEDGSERPAAHHEVLFAGEDDTWIAYTDQFGFFVKEDLMSGEYVVCASENRPPPNPDGSFRIGCDWAGQRRRVFLEPGEVELDIAASP